MSHHRRTAVASRGETRAYGTVDVLVNNAGMPSVAPAENLSLADWRAVLDLNLTAPFLCAQAAGRIMLAKGKGVIVNVGSVFLQQVAHSNSSAPWCVAICQSSPHVSLTIARRSPYGISLGSSSDSAPASNARRYVASTSST